MTRVYANTANDMQSIIRDLKFQVEALEKAFQKGKTIIDEISLFEEKPIDNLNTKSENEVSPQLFSDDDITDSSSESNSEEFLKNEEEEDFEIPAFLRKQKY